ncbi:3'(2'),5'-bisphosphate nucleotidase CysQ, partial [Bacteroidota bacterium]
IDIKDVIQIARDAGQTILPLYNSYNLDVRLKLDNSPVTEADKLSNDVITSELKSKYQEIPVLSEEGKSIPYEERRNWQAFWLVDPLDGTKEFISKSNEFTVNIALIKGNKPVMGVIFAPAMNMLYYAEAGIGSYKQDSGEDKEIKVDINMNNNLTAVISKSHSSPEEERVLKKYKITNTIKIGSSLKFCYVAEGRAHLYYRHGPTYEWDTAAGHAIAEIAGAKVGNLVYNKPNLTNPSFAVKSTRKLNR